MSLYRAVPSDTFSANSPKGRHPTPRVPLNVPLLVDNLWEALRPQHMPSRRFAVYCSPTPELALANASAKLRDGGCYLICELAMPEVGCRIAQLQVVDARRHRDVTALPETLAEIFERATVSGIDLSPFLAPAATADELSELGRTHSLAAELLEVAVQVSTFWNDASLDIVATSDGEIFFELVGDANYVLQPF